MVDGSTVSPPGATGVGTNEDVAERGGGVEGTAKREVGREELGAGVGRNVGVATPVADEREEEECDEGIAWPGGGMVAEGGDFPRREGGIMLGASSIGRSLPRTFSAMRYMAKANCSAVSLPRFCVSHKVLNREMNMSSTYMYSGIAA